MAKGPLGNSRFTTVGPFTYDENSPPEVPSDFEKPDEITDAVGSYTWWNNFNVDDVTDLGATILYDPQNDRVFVANRANPDGEGEYTHDDIVRDIITKGPFGKLPKELVPGEAGIVEISGDVRSSLEVPTQAGGAFIATNRLDEDKNIIEDGGKVEVEWFYKIIYTLKLINFPGNTLVMLRHNLGLFDNEIIKARRKFNLKEAYRMLQFERKLPEPKF